LALGLSLDMTELLAVMLTIFFSLGLLVLLDRWWER
jgi:hypothetical protein